MTIKDKAIQFRNLSKNINKVATDWLVSNSDIIIDELRLQWDSGDAELGKMPTYATPSYALAKQKKGSKSGMHYDLNLQGDFRDAMYAKPVSKGIQISSKDSKLSSINKLTKGDNIWKLNKEHKKTFVELALPDFQKRFKNELK